jgi:hypothetical protein
LQRKHDFEEDLKNRSVNLKEFFSGEELFLSTPDGASIEAMIFESEKFITSTSTGGFLSDLKFNDQKNSEKPNYQSRRPCVIINGSMSFKRGAGIIAFYLNQGVDVFAYDSRKGSLNRCPASKVENDLDAETAYQFLIKQGYADKDMIVHGHCLTSFPLTKLATRHCGMHVVIDRSYVNLGDDLYKSDKESIDKQSISLPSKTAKKIGSFIYSRIVKSLFSDDHTTLAPKIAGNVCFINGKEDSLVTQTQVDAIKKAREGKSFTQITTDCDHERFFNKKEEIKLLKNEGFTDFLNECFGKPSEISDSKNPIAN